MIGGIIRRKFREVAIRLVMVWERGDRYTRRAHAIGRLLLVPWDGEMMRKLPLQREAQTLVAVPCGLDGGLRRMTPETRDRFLEMQATAAEDGVQLLVRWAYRSVDDQAQIIRELLELHSFGKLATWVAPPGYSEHHTGRALDFECIPANAEFQDTAAFRWLCENAWRFDFRMSYPKENEFGIMYEPWHWCYVGKGSPGG
jgi:D-alanyl-D-alanine carboxypeptidase